MLQIDHIYHFLNRHLFHDFYSVSLKKGYPTVFSNDLEGLSDEEIELKFFEDVMPLQIMEPVNVMNPILLYDQEPLIKKLYMPYVDFIDKYIAKSIMKGHTILVSSERSVEATGSTKYHMYYFYHGFAAIDWFRGYHALNVKEPIVRKYRKDFMSFNRLVNEDRSYRIYLLSRLVEEKLIGQGLISFNVSDSEYEWRDELDDPSTRLSDSMKDHIRTHLDVDRLVLDFDSVPACKSATVPIRINISEKDLHRKIPNDTRKPIKRDAWNDPDAFWHLVSESVFYYDKLHLTEKIFKPIVMKQPFMLLAAPGNLAYLRSYGFKTFEGIIDESYDTIKSDYGRINAVVDQLKWYCSLNEDEKTEIQKKCEPIIEHNFHHFYGKFREIITDELLDNSKKLFEDIGYDDSEIDYDYIRQLLT